MGVSEKVLDAIEMLTSSAIEKAGYDRTIQAQIVSCIDKTIGKYKCKYQDSVFYAYANNSDITFSNGAYVYILVPENDMGKEKTILGTTTKLGINYINQIETDEMYNINGNNGVISNNIYYLDTQYKNYSYTIFPPNNNNNVFINTTALEKYIKESSALLVGATFKTSISPENQYRGHYGIKFNLEFIDNVANKNVIRSYIIDEDNMTGNPYKLNQKTRQYQVFKIDGENFIRISSIEIFCSDFPNGTKSISGKLSNGDIQISNLEICGAEKMTENEIDGVAISFYTPQGTFFTGESGETQYRTITAQIKIKGKLVTSNQNIPFYWGVENVGISPSSQYYNKYLGRGWKCLNEKNIILAGSSSQDPVIEWIAGKDTFILNKSQATARDNRIKVAIVYDGNVITKEINIQNLGANVPEVTIESNEGTKFYYDIGHPTLTCKINGSEVTDNNYQYNWGYINNEGVFEPLSETTDLNSAYATANNNLNNLKQAINNGTKFSAQEENNLKNYQNAVDEYNYIQRVQKNKIYNIQISNITSFATFKCSVYNRDTYLGTGVITLTNSLEEEGTYSLVINNGAMSFQYNENGVAPNNKSLEDPQTIHSLSFTIYDNLGKPISNEIISKEANCKIRWSFPIKDSLLIDQAENGSNSGTDATQTYKYYDNKTSLIYNIAQKYDIKKSNNQIKLTVDYKDLSLTATTDFTFVKQGDPGTNGTEYVVKIVPYTKMANPPLYPIISKEGNNYYVNYGINNSSDRTQVFTTGSTNAYKQYFVAQLWHSGEKIWEGFKLADNSSNSENIDAIHWDNLINKYGTNKLDESSFTINSDQSGIAYNGDTLQNAPRVPNANILKCSISYKGKTYYGTIPFVTAWTRNENYRISLKENTGFRYVIYSSDGTFPQYDSSHPFEFICQEKINNTWEDISNINGNHKISYECFAIGNTKSMINTSTIESDLLTKLDYHDEDLPNQFRFKPAPRYDGMCVNETVCCIYRQNNTIVGIIHIPIHFVLNKYGLSYINDWDGNSIQVNNEGGFILSPQMGAGVKDNNNNFTGVLMGEVRLPNKNTSQIGLLGYNQGERTIFLNSKNGSAIFGKSGKGQIIIDPATNDAMLYSGNFWKNYNNDGDKDGLPSSYTYKDDNYNPSGNCNGQGLLINLTQGEIFSGSGKFYVTNDGVLHAEGGGTIGGWTIGDTDLHSNVSEANGRITLNSEGNGKIYSHSHNTFDSTGQGFYLASDGLSFGSRFRVVSNGAMFLGQDAYLKGDSQRSWKIDYNDNNAHIAYGGNNTQFVAAGTTGLSSNRVYLGTDGIGLGNAFSVDNQGNLITRSGTIGGWIIGANTLKSSDEGIILHSDGFLQGGKVVNGTDYSWKIWQSGLANFNYLTANSGGSIGGWTINPNFLSAGNLKLNKSGSITAGNLSLNQEGAISGSNWSITKDGNAYFGKIYGTIMSGHTLSFGSSSLSSSGAINNAGGISGSGGISTTGGMSTGTFKSTGSTALPGNDNVTIGSKKLSLYVGDLVADNATVKNSLTYSKLRDNIDKVGSPQSNKVVWSQLQYVRDVKIDSGHLYIQRVLGYFLTNGAFSGATSWIDVGSITSSSHSGGGGTF